MLLSSKPETHETCDKCRTNKQIDNTKYDDDTSEPSGKPTIKVDRDIVTYGLYVFAIYSTNKLDI